ncbi:MAG: hypothetical protein KDC24_12560 [Saprospiraceae bacterium]|nr:hypothetical protein [Saprospiraceae bacterium]
MALESTKPVIKNVDIEELKKGFSATPSKAKKAEKEEVKEAKAEAITEAPVKEEKKEEKIPFEEIKKQDETAPVLDPSTLAEQERLEREERLVKDSLRQIALDKKIEERRNQGRGRISIGMNSNINKESPSHNIRYTFSYRDRKIGKTNFSTESYVVFRNNLNDWAPVQENIYNALKIYSLGAAYNFKDESNIWIGRKINPKISSMGAIDGLQGEKTFGNIIVGGILGSRPDTRYYNLNTSLFQAGGYVSHQSTNTKKRSLTTLGFVQQSNKGNTDRRFVYFQHSGTLLEDLHVFSSFEIDLFENVNDNPKSTFRMTNFLVNVRYRPTRRLNISAAYDNRKGVIYYETYKSFIDNLIERETRQGLRLGANYRAFKWMIVGFNSGMRFQKDGANSSKNVNAFVNFTRVPYVGMQASLTGNYLQTGYLKSLNYGVRLNRDIWKGVISGSLYLRRVNYNYLYSEQAFVQDLVELNLYIRITKNLSISLTGEETFRKSENTTRFFARIVQRF